VEVINDVSTDELRYIVFKDITTGAATTVGISSTKLVFNPATGNVGLGTTNAQQKLTVAGNVKISGGIYDSNNNVGAAGSVLASDGTKIIWDKTKGPIVENILYVTADGSDTNTGRKLGEAKRTIGAALAAAATGTVIKVSAGSYLENNPLIIPEQVSIVGDSLREVSVLYGHFKLGKSNIRI
jgi:hypothetical protein